MGPRSDLEGYGKYFSTGIRYTDRPARNKSEYFGSVVCPCPLSQIHLFTSMYDADDKQYVTTAAVNLCDWTEL